MDNPLTKEEQMYWKFVAAEKMYQALLSALGSLVALDIKNHSWGQEILDNIQEVLALAEGRVK